MSVLSIDSSKPNPQEFDKKIMDGKDIFVLFYMDGCGPCNKLKPEWAKIKNILEQKKIGENIIIADIEQNHLSKIKNIKLKPNAFPTMYYISKKGEIQEDYEDSDVINKDRSIDSIIEWIESKQKHNIQHQIAGSKTKQVRIHKKMIKKSRKSKKIIKTRKTHLLKSRRFRIKHKRN
jgi:thiol-disulfide isomerase/thioredoxin